MEALSHRGSTQWAGNKSKKSLPHPTLSQSVEFPPNTNKCNLFVYDVLTAIGVNVALIEHGKSKYLPYFSKVSPPLAGEWANGRMDNDCSTAGKSSARRCPGTSALTQ